MPPTKHKETDIFSRHAYDAMVNLVGDLDAAEHPAPRHDDRGDAHAAARGPLRGAEERPRYIHRAARGIDEEFTVREDGQIANRAR